MNRIKNLKLIALIFLMYFLGSSFSEPPIVFAQCEEDICGTIGNCEDDPENCIKNCFYSTSPTNCTLGSDGSCTESLCGISINE